jgi:putative component of membrane protein insertase Oxa1/YidC/SpoIIIJ protein YidD
MKSAMLLAIAFYRRWISPLKGFSCAYRVYTGHASCSRLGFRAIRRYGALRGMAVLRARLTRCADAHREHRQMHLHLHSQAGFCDGCDIPCDGIDCVNCSGVGDCGSWGGSKKKSTDGDKGQST